MKLGLIGGADLISRTEFLLVWVIRVPIRCEADKKFSLTNGAQSESFQPAEHGVFLLQSSAGSKLEEINVGTFNAHLLIVPPNEPLSSTFAGAKAPTTEDFGLDPAISSCFNVTTGEDNASCIASLLSNVNFSCITFPCLFITSFLIVQDP